MFVTTFSHAASTLHRSKTICTVQHSVTPPASKERLRGLALQQQTSQFVNRDIASVSRRNTLQVLGELARIDYSATAPTRAWT